MFIEQKSGFPCWLRQLVPTFGCSGVSPVRWGLPYLLNIVLCYHQELYYFQVFMLLCKHRDWSLKQLRICWRPWNCKKAAWVPRLPAVRAVPLPQVCEDKGRAKKGEWSAQLKALSLCAAHCYLIVQSTRTVKSWGGYKVYRTLMWLKNKIKFVALCWEVLCVRWGNTI